MDAQILSNWFLDRIAIESRYGIAPSRSFFHDDFDDDAISQWDSSTGTFTTPLSSGRSVRKAATGGSSGNQANLVEDAPGGAQPYKAANEPRVKFGLAIEEVDTTKNFMLFGLADVVPAGSETVTPKFIGFGVDQAGSLTKFLAITHDGGGPTVTVTSVTLDTGFHDFEIVVKSTSRVEFLIDGIKVATHTTEVPSADLMRVLSIETLEAVVHDFKIDYYVATAIRG